MAEPVLRDPVPPEPVRRRGPQPVRAAAPSAEPGKKMPVEEVPIHQVPVESAPAESGGTPVTEAAAVSGTSNLETGSVPIDPARELPPPSSVAEPPQFPDAPATATHGSGTGRAMRTRSANPRPPKGRTPTQEMLDDLRSRLDDLRERVETQTTITGMSLKRELAQDADYVKIRVRYYHQRRPLQALGTVAAGGFVLGLFLGLWRQ